ncbi:MAG: hypothetical protein INF98_06065 [Roseomonas sp.]|nr:hypothetical protein [Roseomonas sp.]
MKVVVKLFACVVFAAGAAVLGQAVWNVASPGGAGLGWQAAIFGAIGAVAGWRLLS